MPPPWLPSVYRRLNPETKEIRLLSIYHANSLTALIECDIQTFELGKAPPFDALSYVWGKPNVTAEIQFFGFSRQITTNLYTALTRLREKGDSKWIWVDALCINQDDITEKNHQVFLMRHIYRRAERVLSWLGEADEDTHLAFSLIERWADAILATSPKLESWPNGEAMRMAVTTIERPFDEEGWAAFGSLVRKTYWERVWILQEVTLAQRCILICGRNEILFHKILWAYRAWISGDLRLIRVAELVRLATEGTQFYNFMRFPLEQGDTAKADSEPSARRELLRLPFLLKRASHLSATNARDKVYGILGLLNVANSQIPIDYGKDVIDTYRNTLLSLFKTTGRLDILAFGGTWNRSANSTASQTWPSWIPDYSQAHDLDIRFCEDSPFFDTLFFHASGKTIAECSIASSDLRRIRIKGMLCDEILAVAALIPRPYAEERLRRWLIFALGHQDNLKPYYAPLQQILFRTIIADHLWRGFESPDFLASHLESEFFRMAAGFMVAVRYIYEHKPLLHFDEIERNASEPQVGLDPEIRRGLAKCLHGHTGQDGDDTHPWKVAQIENFLGPLHSRGHLRWPENIEFNSEEDDQANLLWFRPVFYRTASRCLFVTRTGYMGAGPGNAKEGDKIFLPLGCSVPLIIRAAANNFELVGDAYVCGMMQGEMVQKLEDGLLYTQDIVFE